MDIIEKIRNSRGRVRGKGYYRYSSDNQQDESIDAQRRAVEMYAEKNNIIMVGEYVDKAKTGTTDHRVQFLEMIDDAAQGNFDVVLVHKLDRFARNRRDSIGYRMELKRHGVSLISVLEYMDDSPESVILESVLEAMAEYYSLNLAREVKKGMNENAINALHTGGIPPLGYDVDPLTKKLIINEKEAKAVKLIFQRVREGEGYSAIIEELRILGYKTKLGNPFSKNSLSVILSNEKYTGTYIYNKTASKDVDGRRNSHKSKDSDEIIRLEHAIPEIIARQEFDSVRQLMLSRKHKAPNKKNGEVYLLTGKVVCGVCGCAYVGNTKKDGRNKFLYARYGCNKRHRCKSSVCKNKEIRREYLESFVIESLSKYVFNPARVPEITNCYNEFLNAQSQENVERLSCLNKSKVKLEKKIKNIIGVIAESGSTNLISALDELEAELQNIQQEICKLSSSLPSLVTEEEVESLFKKAKKLIADHTLSSTKALIDAFVNQVIIFPDHVEVIFNFCGNKKIPQHSPSQNRNTVVFSPLPAAFAEQTNGVVRGGGGEGHQTLATQNSFGNWVVTDGGGGGS